MVFPLHIPFVTLHQVLLAPPKYCCSWCFSSRKCRIPSARSLGGGHGPLLWPWGQPKHDPAATPLFDPQILHPTKDYSEEDTPLLILIVSPTKSSTKKHELADWPISSSYPFRKWKEQNDRGRHHVQTHHHNPHDISPTYNLMGSRSQNL
jgi:hypothetical protein